MCGIAVLYNINTHENLIKSMTQVISHRGPDADGHCTHNNVSLGHRRLSILDLSESANQPFYSKCGRYVCVYNGEVYNFNEIKKELNIQTRTTSDTEIIIEAFALLGTKFVNLLNGMFAFVIHDIQEKKLYAFRDRIGIKPLFYYKNGNSIALASELKQIKNITGKSNLSVDRTAISNFLHYGYIPEPRTIYNEVKKFPSGHYAEIKEDDITFSCYWDAENKVSKTTIKNESEAKEKLKSLLESSVKYTMISDVPLGTFLSGGIDSSIVSAIAQKHSSKKLNTFTIGFKHAKNNEAYHAKKIANFLNTNHEELIISEKDAQEKIPLLTGIYDEPFSDSSSIPTLLVSEMTRKKVTVALSGDGGDEMFMGYGSYRWAQRFSLFPYQFFRYPISKILKLGNSRMKRSSLLFDYSSFEKINAHIFSQEQHSYMEKEINEILVNASAVEYKLAKKHHERELTLTEKQAIFDIKNYLKDDLLVKVDRASMYHSLEVRVPLLDHRVVEFALNVDENLKIKNGTQKYLLKQVLYDYIPRELVERPKWGFSIPLSTWLYGDLAYLIDDYLNSKIIQNYNYVNNDYVQQIITRFRKGENYLFIRLWLLIVLHKWLSENIE